MGISSDIVTILNYLLPGFVAAWIFHGLTGHPKTSPFERTVHALILTVIIKAIVGAVGWMLCGIGSILPFTLGIWSETAKLCWAIGSAVFLGHLLAWAANTNWYHKRLYKLRITTKTSFVSEWHSAFARRDCYVILHLVDEFGAKRLLGWPNEWPDDPKEGYFAMIDVEWLTISASGDYERHPAPDDEMILVPATSVRLVEFARSPNTESPDAKEAVHDSINGRLQRLPEDGSNAWDFAHGPQSAKTNQASQADSSQRGDQN